MAKLGLLSNAFSKFVENEINTIAMNSLSQ